jgi:hypothetical protein
VDITILRYVTNGDLLLANHLGAAARHSQFFDQRFSNEKRRNTRMNMTEEPFAVTRSVLVHPAVLRADGWAGYVRHVCFGEWEFHRSVDTIHEPLEVATLGSLLDRDTTLQQLKSLPPMSQAWRWEPTDPFQTSRLPTGATYFFRVNVSPSPNHPEYQSIGGAFIDCWIRVESESAANRIIRRTLEDSAWIIESLHGPETCTEKDYAEDPANLEYYAQSQTDGEVFVFHQYPRDDA